MRKYLFNTSAFLPFANSINETRGLFRLIDTLSGLERVLFKGKEGTFSQKVSDFLPSDLVVIFKDLEMKGLVPEGENQQINFLKELIFYLKDLARIKITLAFEPTNNFILKINNVITNDIGQKVILDIVVDQFIIGGAAFEYQGKVYEYTLWRRLEEVIGNLTGKLSQKSSFEFTQDDPEFTEGSEVISQK